MVKLLKKRYPDKLPLKVVSQEELIALIAIQDIIREIETETKKNDGTI